MLLRCLLICRSFTQAGLWHTTQPSPARRPAQDLFQKITTELDFIKPLSKMKKRLSPNNILTKQSNNCIKTLQLVEMHFSIPFRNQWIKEAISTHILFNSSLKDEVSHHLNHMVICMAHRHILSNLKWLDRSTALLAFCSFCTTSSLTIMLLLWVHACIFIWSTKTLKSGFSNLLSSNLCMSPLMKTYKYGLRQQMNPRLKRPVSEWVHWIRLHSLADLFMCEQMLT